jgi:hypothetical protein
MQKVEGSKSLHPLPKSPEIGGFAFGGEPVTRGFSPGFNLLHASRRSGRHPSRELAWPATRGSERRPRKFDGLATEE